MEKLQYVLLVVLHAPVKLSAKLVEYQAMSKTQLLTDALNVLLGALHAMQINQHSVQHASTALIYQVLPAQLAIVPVQPALSQQAGVLHVCLERDTTLVQQPANPALSGTA